MERSDSLTVMKSLTADYGEDSDEEMPSAVDNISDEETHAVNSIEARPSSLPNLIDDNSNSSSADKPRLVKRTTKLVSYGPDDQEEDDDSPSEEEEEEKEYGDLGDMKKTDAEEKALDSQDASALSRRVRNLSADEIQIPQSPPGKCSVELQEKITRNYERMMKGGFSHNVMIQRRKDFRNPSIYEKLIEFLHIDEKGTNFPPDIFDPGMWGKESFFDELDKTQKKEMEKREKDRKDRTKIDFIVGSKKSSCSDSSAPDEKKRKTKWDSQPTSGVRSSAIPNPSVVTLTTSATGTKTTVISALGSITKKSSSQK